MQIFEYLTYLFQIKRDGDVLEFRPVENGGTLPPFVRAVDRVMNGVSFARIVAEIITDAASSSPTLRHSAEFFAASFAARRVHRNQSFRRQIEHRRPQTQRRTSNTVTAANTLQKF